jgi:hypothetical protein
MPIDPGEYTDLLRAIGRLLDREEAQDVRLMNNGAFLSLSWRSPTRGTDERQYEDHNLEELRRWAREARGDIQRGPREFFADLLRTLGQDLDRDGVDFTQIVQSGDALAVTGSADGRYVRQTYYAGDLQASSQRRRTWRQSAEATESEAVRGAVPAPEPARPVEAPPVSPSGGDLSDLMASAETPLLRRMREAQERSSQD